MRLLLSLFMLSAVASAAKLDPHTSLKEACGLAIQGLKVTAEAIAQARPRVFPSGHRTPGPAETQNMTLEEFEISLKGSIGRLASHLAEGSVDIDGYVRQLHFDADLQAIYAEHYRGSIQNLRIVLHDHASALRFLHLFAGRRFAHFEVHPSLVSELMVVAQRLATLTQLDAAIDLSRLLLDSEPFRSEIRDRDRRAVLLSLAQMELTNLRDHFDDAENFRRMLHTFDQLSEFLEWDAGARNFHVLEHINDSLAFVPVDQITPEHLEFIRAMSRRLPRYGEAMGYHVMFAFRHDRIGDDFLTRHDRELLHYDLNLYNLLAGAAGYPSAMALSHGKPN